MQEGPNIARIAAAIGERARAQMLSALMSGRALTATELADVANVSRSTASSHLTRLERARLVVAHDSGRHRYFRIASAEVAEILERLMGAQHALDEKRFGPRDPALRRARLCYDHLAGEIAVWIYDALEAKRAFELTSSGLSLNESGWRMFARLGIDASQLSHTRRPACRACLDWSERRNHLAGALGALLMKRLIDLRWASTARGSRVVRFSAEGERALRRAFTDSASRRSTAPVAVQS
ncbi:MAG: winged helix-turn-helix transcriptional regulator [Xanthomonadaceae bacterium]|nr:winged helix-turn-helix transcriptional regulator [Xanthomonadaceae bacterium]